MDMVIKELIKTKNFMYFCIFLGRYKKKNGTVYEGEW